MDAFHWYQDQQHGLGLDFKSCVDEVISKIRHNPFIHKVTFQTVRRSVTKRFPFGVFYTIEEEKIVILAVLHARREPMKWKQRT